MPNVVVNEESPPEIFRGYLEECWEHLVREMQSKTPKNSKRAGRAKQPIAEFCGVLNSTVQNWMVGRGIPQGIVRVKLTCYMEMLGYRVIEFSKLSQSKKGFFELLGYNLMQPEVAAEKLYNLKVSTIYAVLWGTQSVNEERTQKMYDLWKENREILEQKKVEEASKYKSLLRLHHDNDAESPSLLDVQSRGYTTSNHADAAISIARGLWLLLEQLSEEGLTDEESESFKVEEALVNDLHVKLGSLSAHLSIMKKK